MVGGQRTAGNLNESPFSAPPAFGLNRITASAPVHSFFLSFQFELLFCIQEEDDSRLRMYVDSLRAKYPKVDCQVSE